MTTTVHVRIPHPPRAAGWRNQMERLWASLVRAAEIRARARLARGRRYL